MEPNIVRRCNINNCANDSNDKYGDKVKRSISKPQRGRPDSVRVMQSANIADSLDGRVECKERGESGQGKSRINDKLQSVARSIRPKVVELGVVCDNPLVKKKVIDQILKGECIPDIAITSESYCSVC